MNKSRPAAVSRGGPKTRVRPRLMGDWGLKINTVLNRSDGWGLGFE